MEDKDQIQQKIIADAFYELDTLKAKLREYLSYSSIDGRTERKALRTDLLKLSESDLPIQ